MNYPSFVHEYDRVAAQNTKIYQNLLPILHQKLVRPHQKLTLSAYCDEDSGLLQMRGEDVLSLCAKKHHLGYILMGNFAKGIGSRMNRIQGLLVREIELNVPSF